MEMNYERAWMDDELNMIFSATEMQVLVFGGGGAVPAAVYVGA